LAKGAVVDADVISHDDSGRRRQLFEQRLSALAGSAADATGAGADRDGGPERPPVRRRTWPERVPLSPAQQRLWVLEKFNPGQPVYHIPVVARLHGELSVPALRAALTELTRRHEQLRIRIEDTPDGPVQRVGPVECALPVTEVTVAPGQDPGATALAVARDQVCVGFDFATGPPARWSLLRLAGDDHVLVGTVHHIVGDGWSIGVLLRDLSRAYTNAVHGGRIEWPEPAVSYLDAAAWQTEWLAGGEAQRQLDYWRTRLAGDLPAVELPTDRPRPRQQVPAGAVAYHRIPADLADQVRALARSARGTTFMVLLAALHALLYRYTGQGDILTGSPMANRSCAEFDDVVGLFLNTLVYRSDCRDDPRFTDLLDQARDQAVGAFAHQDLPFERLVDDLRVPRDPSRNPIFQVSLTVQNATDGTLELPGLTVELPDVDTGTARFDCSIIATEDADGIGLACDYNTRLFDASTIDRLLGHLVNLIASAMADPTRRLSRLDLLDPAERSRLTSAATAPHPPVVACLHHQFLDQARRTPDAIAYTFGDRERTYRGLAADSAKLAARLRALGVGPDTVVGLCVPRGPSIPTGVLGILRAGGAYLPLDPGFPVNRLDRLIRASGTPVVVTDAAVADRLPAHVTRIVLDDLRTDDDTTNGAGDVDDGGCRPENLAYVCYTSGSTGEPKGVQVEHRNGSAFIGVCIDTMAVTPADRIIQFSSLNYDVSMFDIFTALLSGASLALGTDDELLDPARLTRLMRDRSVTIADLPPAMLGLMRPDDLPDLRLLFIGGEAYSGELVNRWRTGGRRFINGYGPTEVTCCCVLYECEAPLAGSPPIGRPLTHHRAYVLDRSGGLAPIGVAGELYVGGTGVARGYLHGPAATAERFLPDGFAPGRVYRTGDLVRYLGDGNLEFLGRVDDQIQLRGIRIEPGEISSVLDQHPLVQQSTVQLRTETPPGPRLVAYVVPAAGRAPEVTDLRAFVSSRLPRVMVPAAFVVVDRIPLTTSGKVDRAALPAPVDNPGGTAYHAPSTPMERLLADNIFADVLGRDGVGVNDNFFDMGGNSLQATQVVSRLRDALQVDVPLSSVFENPTIADLAASVAQRSERTEPSTPDSPDRTDELTDRDLAGMEEDEMDRLLATLLDGEDR
jgi:amino acid adenylation domain-containing protein